MLIFKLLRRQVAQRRVHQAKQQPPGAKSVRTGAHLSECPGATDRAHQADQAERAGGTPAPAAGEPAPRQRHQPPAGHAYGHYNVPIGQSRSSDGIYRVPENSTTFGTRFVIGAGQQHQWRAPHYDQTTAGLGQQELEDEAARTSGQQQRPGEHQQAPATISVNGKPLYC